MKKLEETFNLPPVVDVDEENNELNAIEQQIACVDDKKDLVVAETNSDNEKLETDFEVARNNLSVVVEEGTKSMKALTQLANSTSQPESFDSLASMIRSLSEAAKNLVYLHKQKADVVNPQADRPDLQVLVTTNMITKTLPSTARERLLNKEEPNLIEGEVENVEN